MCLNRTKKKPQVTRVSASRALPLFRQHHQSSKTPCKIALSLLYSYRSPDLGLGQRYLLPIHTIETRMQSELLICGRYTYASYMYLSHDDQPRPQQSNNWFLMQSDKQIFDKLAYETSLDTVALSWKDIVSLPFLPANYYLLPK